MRERKVSPPLNVKNNHGIISPGVNSSGHICQHGSKFGFYVSFNIQIHSETCPHSIVACWNCTEVTACDLMTNLLTTMSSKTLPAMVMGAIHVFQNRPIEESHLNDNYCVMHPTSQCLVVQKLVQVLGHVPNKTLICPNLVFKTSKTVFCQNLVTHVPFISNHRQQQKKSERPDNWFKSKSMSKVFVNLCLFAHSVKDTLKV